MNIKEKPIDYKNGIPCSAELCRITAASPHYHSHDMEFIYCLEGSVNLVAGHQSVRVSEGEIFSLDYQDIHYLYSDEENLVLLFHLDLKRLNTEWDFLENVFFSCESNHCQPYQQEALGQVKEILLAISYALFSGRYENAQINNAANKLMNLLLKYFNWFNYNNQDTYVNQDSYNRFHRVLAYCNENYMNKISISQLAAMEHVNTNYFSQFIHKTVFHKFSNMLKFIRCYEAEQLMLQTDLPLAEISYKCGFSDPKYFYSAFKEWWGCTPTEDRKKYREYMKTVRPPKQIEGRKAAQLISRHITKWLLEKTLN